jgi:hypothetical protein
VESIGEDMKNKRQWKGRKRRKFAAQQQQG